MCTMIIDIDVVIGFNQTLYEVSESEQQALISVTLLNGTLQREAIVTLSITENTAEGMKVLKLESITIIMYDHRSINLQYLNLGGRDFVLLQPQHLTFDAGNSFNTIAVNITNDESFEMDEQFYGLLSTMDLDVTLSPAQTTIRILNDDGITATLCILTTLLHGALMQLLRLASVNKSIQF